MKLEKIGVETIGMWKRVSSRSYTFLSVLLIFAETCDLRLMLTSMKSNSWGGGGFKGIVLVLQQRLHVVLVRYAI